MKCRRCGGTGKVTCTGCEGEGVRYGRTKCIECEGNGLISCDTCSGSGKVSFMQWVKSG